MDESSKLCGDISSTVGEKGDKAQIPSLLLLASPQFMSARHKQPDDVNTTNNHNTTLNLTQSWYLEIPIHTLHTLTSNPVPRLHLHPPPPPRIPPRRHARRLHPHQTARRRDFCRASAPAHQPRRRGRCSSGPARGFWHSTRDAETSRTGVAGSWVAEFDDCWASGWTAGSRWCCRGKSCVAAVIDLSLLGGRRKVAVTSSCFS